MYTYKYISTHKFIINNNKYIFFEKAIIFVSRCSNEKQKPLSFILTNDFLDKFIDWPRNFSNKLFKDATYISIR